MYISLYLLLTTLSVKLLSANGHGFTAVTGRAHFQRQVAFFNLGVKSHFLGFPFVADNFNSTTVPTDTTDALEMNRSIIFPHHQNNITNGTHFGSDPVDFGFPVYEPGSYYNASVDIKKYVYPIIIFV